MANSCCALELKAINSAEFTIFNGNIENGINIDDTQNLNDSGLIDLPDRVLVRMRKRKI